MRYGIKPKINYAESAIHYVYRFLPSRYISGIPSLVVFYVIIGKRLRATGI